MSTPKPITGLCPACKKVTVHRCTSQAANLYQCLNCGGMCGEEEITVEEKAVPPEVRQGELWG